MAGKKPFKFTLRHLAIADVLFLAAACALLRSDAEIIYLAELLVSAAAATFAAAMFLRKRVWKLAATGGGALLLAGLIWAGKVFAVCGFFQLALWGFALSALPLLADSHETLSRRSFAGAPAIAAIALAIGLLVNPDHCDLARNGGFYGIIALALALSLAFRPRQNTR